MPAILVSDLSSQAASLQCCTEILYFPLPPISFLFNGSLFYSSNLLHPLFLLSFIPHTCVPFLSPSPILGSLPWSSTELRFFPSYCCCFVNIYLSMFYWLSFFLLSFFSYRWLSLSPSPALVRNFLSCNVFPQCRMDDYIPPSVLPPTSTLLDGTMLLRTYHCPHSFLYNPVLGFLAFFFDSWPLKRRLIGCPKSSVRNYQYSLHNSPKEQGSFTELVYAIWDQMQIQFILLQDLCMTSYTLVSCL